MPPKGQSSARKAKRAPEAPPAASGAPSSDSVKPAVHDIHPDPDDTFQQAAVSRVGRESSSELASDPPQPQPSADPHPTTEITTSAIQSSPAPAVKRLDTLARPSIGTGGKAPIARPKFTGRRSQTARAELEKQEAERKRVEAEARAVEDAAKARRAVREQERRRDRDRERGGGRGRGRGRGGYVGERERRMEVEASGPFSAGQVSAEVKDKGKRRVLVSAGGGGGGGGGGGREGQSSVDGGAHPEADGEVKEPVTLTTGSAGGSSKKAPRARQTASATTGLTADGKSVKPDPGGAKADPDGDTVMTESHIPADGGYVSSEEDAAEKGVQRRNVDEMIVVDLTLDEEAEQDAKIYAHPPVRLRRDVHRERTLGLNAAGADAVGGLARNELADSGGMKALSEKRRGKQRVRDLEIVGESHAFNAMYYSSDTDTDLPIKSEPVEDDGVTGTLDSAQDHLQEPPSSPEAKRKTKENIKKGRPIPATQLERPAYQTQEEFDEWERHQQDLNILRSELGHQSTKSEDTTMVGTPHQSLDKKADKVYLFQFPPVLPNLSPINTKPDPDAPAPAPAFDAMDVDEKPNDTSNPINVPDDILPSSLGQPKLPSGAVGKLRIHASGRATLDWGGTPLSLGMGTDASFLQDVLVASLSEQKNEGMTLYMDPPVGSAVAMGQVKGKFVVTPDWDEILR